MAEKISSTDLKAQKDNFVIIDVRELDELAKGKIEDSINLPLGLMIEKSVPIVLVVIEETLQLMS